MTKNEIYLEILKYTLSHIRNVQSWKRFKRLQERSCYFESEFIHNIPVGLAVDEFTEHDIWFLNHQAKYYIETCNEKISACYVHNKACIKALFKIIPDNLKQSLKWKGPD